MLTKTIGSSFFSIAIIALLFAPVSAGLVVTYDFETDDFGTALVNGQSISTGLDVQPDTVFEFGKYSYVSTSFGTGNGHEGAAIFDSSNPGPNDSGGDPDLLVNLGNILILQSEDSPATTTGANGTVFTTPNDEASANTGSILFDFAAAGVTATPLSIDIVDANGGFGAQVILTDAQFDTRTYTIPEKWTFEVTSSLNGYDTLDLTSLVGQDGEGAGSDGIQGNADDFTTVVQDANFDANLVRSLEVKFTGNGTTSGGIDNLVFMIPEPTTAMLTLFASLAALPLMRRRQSA